MKACPSTKVCSATFCSLRGKGQGLHGILVGRRVRFLIRSCFGRSMVGKLSVY